MEKNISDVLWKAERWMVESLVLYSDFKCDPEGILRFWLRTSTSTQAAPPQIQSAIEIWCFCVWCDNNIRSGRAGCRVSRKPYLQSTIYKVQKLSKCCFFQMFLNCRSFPQMFSVGCVVWVLQQLQESVQQ